MSTTIAETDGRSVSPTEGASEIPAARRTRTLATIGVNHALHDGYTDLIYVLLPVWQAEFGLGYVALALVRSLYVGALAGLQMPATALARVLGARIVLVLGTLLGAGAMRWPAPRAASSASASPWRSPARAAAPSIPSPRR